MMAKDTMKAVVFKGPMKVELVDRPVPKIQDKGDVIVKVEYSALCGRYLQAYAMVLDPRLTRFQRIACFPWPPAKRYRLHHGP